ncbi:hypothetical protein [Pisciglobus halotolerans]|uniref:Uncharacterized protein n=1 Tax=Pisciglobus halotolerans TaxID=745365 RepID=A0A1I3D9W8_9LACT|nr:hypothetical protein [Pisciglobus halotolerans]SFH83527.1 hypothetical protein SAMN04489868_1328 [Pisciglobus halotolerans]
MSSLKSIQTKMDQIEKLKIEVEEAKKEIHTSLGERIIKSLELDYEMLSSKKDINSVVNRIVESLPDHLFTDLNNDSVNDENESTGLNHELQNS